MDDMGRCISFFFFADLAEKSTVSVRLFFVGTELAPWQRPPQTHLSIFLGETSAFFIGGGGMDLFPKGCLGFTPRKINMEPTNHQFRKEHDLPGLHDYVAC